MENNFNPQSTEDQEIEIKNHNVRFIEKMGTKTQQINHSSFQNEIKQIHLDTSQTTIKSSSRNESDASINPSSKLREQNPVQVLNFKGSLEVIKESQEDQMNSYPAESRT